MKSLKLLIIAVLVAFNTNAQVKVLTNGNCGIGTTSPATKLEVTGGQFQISGKNNIYLKDEINANDPGDIVFYGGSTELGRIWRYGTGMYIRAKNSGYGAIRILSSNENVGIGYNASSSYKLVIGGDVYAYGSYLPSDKRLKKNIVNISAPIDNILRLQGIKYEYDIDKIKELNKSKQKGINTDSLNIHADSLDINCFNTKKMGFIAQDFQKVFPDLVKMDEDSLLSIDYIGLIPVLVEAIKIQQDKIDNLEKQIIKGNLKNGTIQSSTNPDNVERLENALLFQNTPNPFSDKTEIKFFLPDNIKVAQLNIYNMQGLQIKSYSLSQRGSSSIIVNGYELQAGMYMYSLIADSKEIDTKRMILTD